MENTVTISTIDYEELLLSSYKLDMLIEVLVDSARLNWNKTGLKYEEDQVNPILNLITPAYRKTLKELKKEAENESDRG